MRLILVLCVLTIAAIARSQTPPPVPTSLFTTMKPDGYVRISDISGGGQLVEVTMQDSKYPVDLLKSQLEALGRELQVTPVALQVFQFNMFADDPKSRYTRARCGLRNLSDTSAGVFRIQPILRAFAGAPAPNTVNGLAIIYERAKPTRKTLLKLSNSAVQIEMNSIKDGLGVEYRVQFKSQVPGDIEVPEDATAPVAAPKPLPPPGPDRVLISLIVVAALAAGALVYSLLLRGRPSGGPRAR